jgi:hypothetical protein
MNGIDRDKDIIKIDDNEADDKDEPQKSKVV